MSALRARSYADPDVTQTAATDEPAATAAADRLPLLILALCDLHDRYPAAAVRLASLPGRGETTTPTGGSRAAVLDELLASVERDLARVDEQPSSLVERAAVRDSHPAYRRLEDALAALAVEDPAGAKLVRRMVADAAGRPHLALVWAWTLPYVTSGGPGCPVETPRYRLVRALHRLADHLGDVRWPASLAAREAEFRRWIAEVRPKTGRGGKTVRSGADTAALRQRDRLVLHLAQAGFSQRAISSRLGISQPFVHRILARQQ